MADTSRRRSARGVALRTVRPNLRLPEETAELAAGSLLVVQQGVKHDVEAVADSTFLLTLGWRE